MKGRTEDFSLVKKRVVISGLAVKGREKRDRLKGEIIFSKYLNLVKTLH